MPAFSSNCFGLHRVTGTMILTPIFDWRQLRRWNISESRLPPESKIRFRDPGLWEQYNKEILAAFAVLFMQST
jgi:hypothetical protein